MTKSPVVFMFSGQGSQYYHMGTDLFHQDAVFNSWMNQMNEFVYRNAGIFVLNEIYHEKKRKNESFDQLSYTHPAIFMVEYALAQSLMESGVEPDWVLGASLGEFTAAAVAGVISYENALEILVKQAELVTNYCSAGSMIAVIHSPELYHYSPFMRLNSELAAINYASHFIISGEAQKLSNIEMQLKAGEIPFQTLPVQYGFHSENIDSIEYEYCSFLHGFQYQKSKIGIVSCMLHDISCCPRDEAAGITADFFWDVIRRPIQFQTTIQRMEQEGSYHYIDLGPSGTLANFVKYNLSKHSSSRYYSIITPFNQDLKNFKTILESFQK